MTLQTSPPLRRAFLFWATPFLSAFRLRLFVNNWTPAPTDTSADYLEPSGAWYVPITLNLWQLPYIDASLNAIMQETIRTWTATSGVMAESVYGYWVTDPNGNFCWAETVPAAPIPMNIVGLTVSVLPRLFQGLLC